MKKRRDVLCLSRDIYFLLKEKREEYSINRISKAMNSKYEATIKALEFLKEVGLIKERKGDGNPAPRFFSFCSKQN